MFHSFVLEQEDQLQISASATQTAFLSFTFHEGCLDKFLVSGETLFSYNHSGFMNASLEKLYSFRINDDETDFIFI